MLTPNLVKSELSVAYVHAVAAKCGISLDHPKIDTDSVDVKLKMKTPSGRLKTSEIDLQLKATSSTLLNPGDESFAFDLSIKNYNDLRSDRHTPILLVILRLPADEKEWLLQSQEQLIMQKCAYWYNLKGNPERHNHSQVRINVPLSQVFSPEQLLSFMSKISNAKEL
ncbi:MAG: DUF4365 domain-containing protein [Bacteroidota bacterium]|jgi:hypothetical protein